MIDDAEDDGLPRPHALTFAYGERVFWVLYLLIPIFTGFMAYRWLPNESFDAARHISLASHEVCEGDTVERCGEMEDVWKDKKSGEIFVRDQFAEHRLQEGIRLGWLSFVYGLIGCSFFAYTMANSDEKEFRTKFIKALWVNLGVAFFSFFAIWH